MTQDPHAFLTAREAAARLEVSLPTLYAYVSRGLVRSETLAGARERGYHAADIEALVERKARRREPERAASTALDWGAPVLSSAITAIQDGRLAYRGQDVTMLAAARSFEEVASLLWEQPFVSPPAAMSSRLEAIATQLATASPAERFSVLLPLAALDDLAALDPRPHAFAQAGVRILRLLAHHTGPRPLHLPADAPIASVLAAAWGVAGVESALDAALVLAADHELNVSAFTARCVASAGSPPYAVVGAGLAALQGARHGGHCERVEALYAEAGTPARAGHAIAARLRRGEAVPGFGQPLYPAGDPRGRMLLELAGAIAPDPLAAALVAGALEVVGELPTIDFGLVTLARALRLPAGSALALFAIGRSAGWIAHALEQVAQGGMIRPRARYTGLPLAPYQGQGA